MQIMIDIPEEHYNAVKNGQNEEPYSREFVDAIVKGTPLPKGHGVLKDVTSLMRGLYVDMQTEEMMFTSSEVYKLIDEECPTIIEADKEVQE